MKEIHYLYKITNQINGKIYIGQTINPVKRWSGHKNQAKKEVPTMLISRAIKKHGSENFMFEVIAECKTYEDANWAEEELIKQHNSLASSGNGYNLSLGGETAPKSEEWIAKMKTWHASLSPEEKQKRNEMHREAMINQINTKGHPALGHKWTEEQKSDLSTTLKSLDRDKIYTQEVRLHMSESHIGYKDSEEVKQKKSESAKEAWEKRIDYSRKCEAPGCEVSGKAKYKFINGVRYCNKHGLRMLRYGRLDCMAP